MSEHDLETADAPLRPDSRLRARAASSEAVPSLTFTRYQMRITATPCRRDAPGNVGGALPGREFGPATGDPRRRWCAGDQPLSPRFEGQTPRPERQQRDSSGNAHELATVANLGGVTRSPVGV